MKKEGECEWYQSMGHIFLYISANFLLSFKGPRPFKKQKTLFSGLTTQNAPRLNQGTSAAKKHDSGWVLAWIFLDSGSNLFRSMPVFMTVKCEDWNSGGFSPRTIHRFNALLVSSIAEHSDGFLLL